MLSTITGCVSHSFPVVRPSLEIPPEQNATARAKEYFIQARDLERRGENQSSIHFYEMAYELDPSSIILRNELIRKYIEAEKYTQALILAKGEKNNNQLDRDTRRIVSTIYLKMGNLEKAADILESIKDKSVEETYSLGLIYESLGKINKSIDYYLDFYRNDPDAAQMGLKIGKLLISEKRFDEADSLFLVIKSKVGDIPELLVMMGTSKIVNSDTVAGIELFKSALAIDSVNEDALRGLAQVYMTQNDYSDAISCYEKLVYQISYGRIYGKTLALLYYYNKQYGEAETLLKSLLQDLMNDHELHYYLGLVFSASKKLDLAQIELEKTISIKEDFHEAWKELCYIQVREKNYDAAQAVAQRYTKSFPKETLAWQMQGMVQNFKKEYSEAVKSFSTSLILDSTNAYAWFELGSAYERQKQIDSAAMAFTNVLKLQPDDPSACNYLGYMWAEKGINLDSAMVLLQTALRQEPENGAFLDSYAWIFYQLSDYDSAYYYIQKAVAAIDDDPTIYCHLGDIYEKKGNLMEALKAYKKSLELKYETPEELERKIGQIEVLLKQNEKK